jgi:hypothetical protein
MELPALNRLLALADGAEQIGDPEVFGVLHRYFLGYYIALSLEYEPVEDGEGGFRFVSRQGYPKEGHSAVDSLWDGMTEIGRWAVDPVVALELLRFGTGILDCATKKNKFVVSFSGRNPVAGDDFALTVVRAWLIDHILGRNCRAEMGDTGVNVVTYRVPE